MTSDDPEPARQLPQAFFERRVDSVAQALIGATLAVGGVGGKIVETEAYDALDPASHSFAGRTTLNASMFGPAGHCYVYRSYGLHWCLNFTCGDGSAVLIRAVQPETGIETMIARRGLADLRLLCAGPGRLCQALAIDGGFDGMPLEPPLFTLIAPESAPDIVAGPRIGITRGTEAAWRFGLAGSRFLSRSFGTPQRVPDQDGANHKKDSPKS